MEERTCGGGKLNTGRALPCEGSEREKERCDVTENSRGKTEIEGKGKYKGRYSGKEREKGDVWQLPDNERGRQEKETKE